MLKKKVIVIGTLLMISLISVILFNHEYYSLPDDADLLSRQSKVDDEIKSISNGESLFYKSFNCSYYFFVSK